MPDIKFFSPHTGKLDETACSFNPVSLTDLRFMIVF